MDVDDILSDEYPFSFILGPLSLVTLASTKLSLVLWRYKIVNGGNTPINSILQRNFTCDEFFEMPPSIKTIIDRKIISMRDDLENWVKFYSKLGSEMRPVFSTSIDDIVCEPNGRISFKKTTIKVLQRDLDFKLKYQIACTFCLEDEVDRLFPAIWEDCPVFVFRGVQNPKALFYWYCRMMETPQRDSTTPENRVIEAYKKRNWPALEFHWSTLNDEQRISMALEVFRYNNTDAMMCVLPKLNEYQAQKVFEAKSWEILSILLSNHEYIEHMLALWTRMEKMVSEEVFLRLIRGLWKLTWNTSKADCMEKFKMDGLLTEIWARAPDQFRSYVLNHSAEFFDNLPTECVGFRGNYGHDMEFLLDLLRNNSPEFRRTIWMNNWRKIVVRAKLVNLKKFLELCLPNDTAIDNFKSKELLTFRPFCYTLIRNGFYSDLAEYLNFCSETFAIEKEITKEILTSHAGLVIFNLLDGNNLENFNLFVDRLFSSADGATEFKQFLIRLPNSEKSLFGMFNNGRLEDFKRIISSFATSEANLRELKSEFLERCRNYLTSKPRSELNVSKWQELLKWCARNEAEIAAFKKSLDIDALFEFFFQTYGCYLKSFDSGKLLFYDNFFSWYFVDERAKNNFTLSKVNNYNEGKAVRTFLEKASRPSIFKMLNWAFQNDSKMVLMFQKRLVRDKIITSVIKADESDVPGFNLGF